jgi:hypothetical protein
VEIVLGVVAFAVVAGWAALSWLRHGRDPSYGDDPSILAAAPPPEMTAATATVVSGGAARMAFVAAMLDLASRDEIAFRQGSGAEADAVGIEIHGGDSTDPQVGLNRRRPVGEGEAWLLGQLHLEAAMAHGRPMTPMAGLGMASMFGSMLAFASGTRDQPGANEAGMFGAGQLDPDALAAAYQSRHGKPMPEHLVQELRILNAAPTFMRDPQAIVDDPAGTEARLAALGIKLTPEQVRQVREWAAQQVATNQAPPPSAAPASQPAVAPTPRAGAAPAPQAGPAPTQGALFIEPSVAPTIPAPIGFGSLLENYARRHGWLGGLSFIERWKWRALAGVEVVVGLIVAGVGSASTTGSSTVSAVTALGAIGIGIAAGGVATWLIAPAMPARTHEGAVMVAQLAAYRRTLKMTFDGAVSMNDALGKSGLHWLETPDQVLVWGMALGLRAEIEAVLQRANAAPAGTVAGGTYAPGWYRDPDSARVTTIDPARMFSAIEAIGSRPDTSEAFGGIASNRRATG